MTDDPPPSAEATRAEATPRLPADEGPADEGPADEDKAALAAGEPVLAFLTPDLARGLLAQLAGIDQVLVRILGDHPAIAAEVEAFLRTAGFAVTAERLERMEPPPLKRLALRYAGRAATLTVAPLAPV